MIITIKKIFFLLNRDSKKKLLLSQILLITSAIFEMLGLLSIFTLVQIITNSDIVNDSTQLISKIYIYLNFSNYPDFLITVSIIILLVFFISFLLSVYTLYFTARFSEDIDNYLKSEIFKIYSLQPWIFHSQRETSSYINMIDKETHRIANSAIYPILQVNGRIITSLAIVISIFFYNPMVTSVCFLFFFIFYIIMFKIIKKKNSKRWIDTRYIFRGYI